MSDEPTNEQPRPRGLQWVLAASVAVVVIVVAVLVLTGGGGSGPKAANAMELATKLKNGGLGCADAKSDKPDNSFGTAITTELVCTVKGEVTTIDVYADHGALENALGIAKGIGCRLAKGFGIKSLNFAVGNNWTIAPSSETTAKKIRSVAGGTTRTITC